VLVKHIIAGRGILSLYIYSSLIISSIAAGSKEKKFS